MLTRKSIYTLLLALCLLPFYAAADDQPPADTHAVDQTKMVLRDAWVEHVFWIRSYILAVHAADADQQTVAEQQVVANARGLADSITPFYGQDAADGLFNLLAGHWGAVKAYGAARFDGSADGQSQATEDLTANAQEIAAFLSTANPFLPQDAVFGLLSAHGAHHVAQINEIEAHDYAAEAKTWSAMRQHMLVIADAITGALAKQFPASFQG